MRANRIIKFRAWHKGYEATGHLKATSPQMIYSEIPSKPLQWLEEGQPVEIMQFTGQLDKAGKEVYESDINQDGGKVIWNQDDACFCWEYPNGDIHPFDKETPEWCEIIGSIYTTPNLLTPQTR